MRSVSGADAGWVWLRCHCSLLICSRWVAMEAEVAADGLEAWLPGGSSAGRAEAVAAVQATIVAVRAMRCEVFM